VLEESLGPLPGDRWRLHRPIVLDCLEGENTERLTMLQKSNRVSFGVETIISALNILCPIFSLEKFSANLFQSRQLAPLISSKDKTFK
jgi:hypothetical protein